MSLRPNRQDRIAKARAELRIGLPVLLVDNGFAALVLAAEEVKNAQLAELHQMGLVPVLAITSRRAETLKARAYDGDLARIVLPKDTDAPWILSVIDPASDLEFPMKGPFNTLRDRSAAIHRAALSLCKQAHLLPAALVAEVTQLQLDKLHSGGLTRLELGELTTGDALPEIHEISHARVPLLVSEQSQIRIYRPADGGEEHYAIIIGAPDHFKAVLCRLHSACFTGDVLGSLKCDCGAQLQGAMEQIAAEGAGVLLYLNQEGRGIGLANKMRAYSLQDQGFDTVEANHRLGFEDDERDFRIGAQILKKLGFSSVRLLTNNPAKVERMNSCGMKVVERVPLRVGKTAQNAGYLAVKAAKSGHIL